jgi:SAM-dependent methyltransferase
MSDPLKKFYEEHLQQFGSSAQGVGWKNVEAQVIRFEQLAKVFKPGEHFSINDLGCGVGDFVGFLDRRNPGNVYRGYDVMPEMITKAKAKYDSPENKVSFIQIGHAREMQQADYTIASGIFNIRFETDDESWLKYILETLEIMNEKSLKGFAFNILTSYSDKEFMKPELYYADPAFLFDFCKRKFSKNVALLHDYNQFDFTMIIRKQL